MSHLQEFITNGKKVGRPNSNAMVDSMEPKALLAF